MLSVYRLLYVGGSLARIRDGVTEKYVLNWMDATCYLCT